MKKTFIKQIIPKVAILITMVAFGFGAFISQVQAGGPLNPLPVSNLLVTLTYTAGAHGSISGTTPQQILKYSSGTQVTAVPNVGYKFVQWSDGVTTASRTDSNVASNLSVTASFALNVIQVQVPNIPLIPSVNLTPSYTLNYTAQGNHGVILGTNPQTVDSGSSGTSVVAVAKPHYVFAGWSDGVVSDTRNESNVTSDMNITALFDHEITNLTSSHLVTYAVPSGRGYIQGDDSQWVVDGEDATTVKAVAHSGYHFTKWSDGNTHATRTDEGVTGDLELIAIFSTNSSGGGSSGNTGQTADQILGSGACPLELTLTQNLKSGAHDGEYLKYNGGVVTQVAILQRQINRILAAKYNQAAGPIDGRFGPLTKLGVIRLQLALVEALHADLGPKGPDGVVGAYTRAAINNSCGGM